MDEKQRQREHNVIFVLLYGFLAFVVLYIMTSGGMGVSFDSERYLLMAQYFKEAEWGNAFNPIWPPFYPMTIALTSIVGVSHEIEGARIISIFAFVISVVVVFFLGRYLQGKATAHFGTISMLVFAPLIFTFSYCWSETVYIVLSLLFLLMLVLLLHAPEEKSTKYLVGSAIFAGLGFLTRYLGLSLIVTGLVMTFFFGKSVRPIKRFKKTLLFGILGFLPILFNFLMCFIHLGSTTREAAPAEFSFFQQIIRLFVSIYRDFLSFDLTFQKYAFFFGSSTSWDKLNSAWFLSHKIILLCLFVFAVFSFKLVFSSRSFRSLLKPQIPFALYMAIYSIVILGISSTIHVDPIGSRFNAPIYPIILLLVFSSIFHIFSVLDQRRMKFLFLYSAILGIHLFWGIQLVSCLSMHKGISSGSFPAMENPGNRNRESLKFLKKNLSSQDIIITNVPHKLGFIWPRELPYLAAKTGELNRVVSQLTSRFPGGSIYVLICKEDYSIYRFAVDFESYPSSKTGQAGISKEMEHSAWTNIFGNDYICKAESVAYYLSPEK